MQVNGEVGNEKGGGDTAMQVVCMLWGNGELGRGKGRVEFEVGGIKPCKWYARYGKGRGRGEGDMCGVWKGEGEGVGEGGG